MDNIVNALKKQGVINTGLLLDVMEKTKVIDKPTKKSLRSMHSDTHQMNEDSFKDIIKRISVKKRTGVRNVLNSLNQIITTKSFPALVETLNMNAALMEEARNLEHNMSSVDTIDQSGEDDVNEENSTEGDEDEASVEDEDSGEERSKKFNKFKDYYESASD